MPVYPFRKIERLILNGEVAATNKEKGDALESAICLCMGSIIGISVIDKNIVSDTGSQEIDISLWNEKNSKAIPFFGDVILVECKNWTARVDSKSIRDFVGKLRAAKVKSGILVAANGVTGDEREVTAGYDVIRHAFDSDEIYIYVMTRDDLLSFRSGEEVVLFLRGIFQRIILRKNPF